MAGRVSSQGRVRRLRVCPTAVVSLARGWQRRGRRLSWQTTSLQMLLPLTLRPALQLRRRPLWPLPPLQAWCCPTADGSRAAAVVQQQVTTAALTGRAPHSGQCSGCTSPPPGMLRHWTSREAATTAQDLYCQTHLGLTTGMGISPAAQPAHMALRCGTNLQVPHAHEHLWSRCLTISASIQNHRDVVVWSPHPETAMALWCNRPLSACWQKHVIADH